jgi:hypothetical protein
LPDTAAQGHRTIRARTGKKLHLESDTKINITKADHDGTENLVLGQQLKTMMTTLLNLILAHKHTCNVPGNLSTPPDVPTINGLNNLKASPVGDEAFLSSIAFTEKGN